MLHRILHTAHCTASTPSCSPLPFIPPIINVLLGSMLIVYHSNNDTCLPAWSLPLFQRAVQQKKDSTDENAQISPGKGPMHRPIFDARAAAHKLNLRSLRETYAHRKTKSSTSAYVQSSNDLVRESGDKPVQRGTSNTCLCPAEQKQGIS